MTQLAALKAASSLHGIAHLLGFKPAALAYILYKLNDSQRYKQFEIPKRSGGKRTIKAPTAELKLLQRKMASLLENCISEINVANKRADLFAHGFKKGRSIFSNARPHRNRQWVFNIDLENFFGSINFGRVRGFFLKDRDFALHQGAATIIAQVACVDNALPQGSPCSPIISNLIGHLLDVHLAKLAASCGCHYSRYADDLTFSTNAPQFPSRIATRTRGAAGDEWMPGAELHRIIQHARFAINPQKTRMQFKDSRQDVTGLVVNKKLNVKTEYRRSVRAMVHRLLTHGHFERTKRVDDGAGNHVLDAVKGTTAELHGMLGFIDSVEHYNRNLVLPKGGKPKVEKKKKGTEPNKPRVALTGKEVLYRRFLLYKEFFATSNPVLICEGETDNIYLVHAIRSLATHFPLLATVVKPGEIKIIPRIFKYVETSTGRILGLGSGGTGDLGNLIRQYDKEIKRFVRPATQHPFILVVDNDAGAVGAGRPLQASKQVTGLDVNRHAPFTNVCGNLYLVPTPFLAGAAQSMIEDFFTKETLDETIDGKSFCASNKQDSAKQYGKKVFAHKVVKVKADTIDFKGFFKLLENITLAIEDFYKKHPSAPITSAQAI